MLAANGVEVMIDDHDGYTPTPVISHAILAYNHKRTAALADGIVITPSHNPPEDGGFKYNPPHGGPADTGVTRWIEDHANALLADESRGVKRMSYERARSAPTMHRHDYLNAYVNNLESVIDMDVLHGAKLKVGVDPWAVRASLSGSLSLRVMLSIWIYDASCKLKGGYGVRSSPQVNASTATVFYNIRADQQLHRVIRRLTEGGVRTCPALAELD